MLYWIWIPLSFLLHLITLFGLIILYQRYKTLQAGQVPDVDQLNEQLNHFLRQVQHENEAFYQKVVNYINDEGKWLQQRETHKAIQEEKEQATKRNDVHEGLKRVEFQAERVRPGSKAEKVMELLKQGYSPQEIARQLDMGVGEVQLLSNLYGREDE